MLKGGRRGFWRPKGAKMAQRKGLGKAKLSPGPFAARAGLTAGSAPPPLIKKELLSP